MAGEGSDGVVPRDALKMRPHLLFVDFDYLHNSFQLRAELALDDRFPFLIVEQKQASLAVPLFRNTVDELVPVMFLMNGAEAQFALYELIGRLRGAILEVRLREADLAPIADHNHVLEGSEFFGPLDEYNIFLHNFMNHLNPTLNHMDANLPVR